jgi:hypothetical protein
MLSPRLCDATSTSINTFCVFQSWPGVIPLPVLVPSPRESSDANSTDIQDLLEHASTVRRFDEFEYSSFLLETYKPRLASKFLKQGE